jgi:tRNA acetyltransferase TAN1
VEKGAALDVGFEGIWVTCARGAEKKAMAELTTVCAQYGQQMWPLSLSDDPAQLSRQSELSKGDPDSLDDVPSTDGEFDIEASISREIQSMKSSGVSTAASSLRQTRMFTPIRSAMECVFFMRTKPPIIPLDLTMRICIESRHSRDGRLERMCRYVNRITPVATMDKATANGVARVARRVLAPYFDLTADSAASELEQNTTQREETQEAPIVESRSIETGSRRQCGNHLDKGAPTDVAEHTVSLT